MRVLLLFHAQSTKRHVAENARSVGRIDRKGIVHRRGAKRNFSAASTIVSPFSVNQSHRPLSLECYANFITREEAMGDRLRGAACVSVVEHSATYFCHVFRLFGAWLVPHEDKPPSIVWRLRFAWKYHATTNCALKKSSGYVPSWQPEVDDR